MPGCSTGRNIQKYKGAAASTLQDVTDNGNTTTGDLITTSGYFIGDGSLLTGISGANAAFPLQDTSDRGNTTSNTIQFTNTQMSFITSGNIFVASNVTANEFYGDGTTLTGVALSTDMTSNASRVTNLETDMTSNASRITTVENNVLVSNSSGITSGIGQGDILIGDAANTLTKLSLGADSHVLTSNTTTGKPEWKSASNIGTTVATLSNTAYIIGGSYNGGGPKTWSLKASTANSTDHIVIRDDSGNVYATEYHGDYIKHAGDIDTHLGFPSNDTFTVTTDGTERMKIDSSGTTIPEYIIHGGSDTDTYFGFPGNDQFTIRTGGTDRLNIDFSGNTTIPDYIRHGGSDTDTYFGFPSNDTFTVTTDGTERMKIDSSGTTIPEYIIHNGDTNTKFGFPSNDTFTVTTNNNERLRIDSSGKVGISNTNPQDELSVGGDINLTGKIKINGSTGNANQVLTSGGGSGAMIWADAGAATNYWVRTGSSPNYTVTTSTPESNVGIANTSALNQTLHIGSNVIVNDTGNHDVFRVNGNVFCTNYLFGDGSKIRNLNTIRTETGKNQISIGGDDGGPVLPWRERQIRYQHGSGRPDPQNYS